MVKNSDEKIYQWQEGDYTITRSHAWSGPGCHDGCGVLLYTLEGKLVKVEGDPDHPFNQGRLCARCLGAVPAVVNHEDRVRYPMKRIGKRGENNWERITWEEAYDLIEKQFTEIKQQHGAESVVFGYGTARDIFPQINRLAYSFGSPNACTLGLSGAACYLPRVAAMYCLMGGVSQVDCAQYFSERYRKNNWKYPETVMVWGNNTIRSNADGFFGHWIVDLLKRGTKIIVIDPRMTWLASRAEHWLQIRPGTDAALALGMLNVIINENLYDHEFVDKWTFGFDKLKERVQEYPVERVAEITWVPKEKIVAAARLFAKSKPAAVQWGVAIDMTKESFPASQAILSLWSITGNVDIPGGMILQPNNPAIMDIQGGWGYDLLNEEQKSKRIGIKEYPVLNFGFLTSQPDLTVEAMLTGKPYPIKGAWIQGNNALACMSADPQKMLKALKNLEFIVVVDLFMTPTAMAVADVVLPAAAYPEKKGLRLAWYHIGAINPVVDAGEVKSDMQISYELGKRFNPEGWPWQSIDELWDWIIQKGTETNFNGLNEQGGWVLPSFEYQKYIKSILRPDGKSGFNTPSGRIELFSNVFEMLGLDPLPYYEEPTESPYSTPDVYQEYPFVLTTGARSWAFFHSETRQIPQMRSLHPDPNIEMHPQAAKSLGVQEGDWVWIENRQGRCRQKVKLTLGLDPRVVSADHGWWYPEKLAEEPSLYGLWDVAINQLVPFLPGRSGFGGNYKSLLCKIYKVKEGEM
ncbi:MAG: molybdopterin-dependent oxidoreductase [Anaerolineales bacterium]|nr:molybdopterin-dependent oxidoreductase [Anaerolineales bacterium]